MHAWKFSVKIVLFCFKEKNLHCSYLADHLSGMPRPPADMLHKEVFFLFLFEDHFINCG